MLSAEAFEGASGVAAACTVVTDLGRSPGHRAIAITMATSAPPIRAETKGIKDMRFM